MNFLKLDLSLMTDEELKTAIVWRLALHVRAAEECAYCHQRIRAHLHRVFAERKQAELIELQRRGQTATATIDFKTSPYTITLHCNPLPKTPVKFLPDAKI